MIRKLMVLTSFLGVVSLAGAATVWNPAANGIVPPATGDWGDVANWTNGLPDNPDMNKAVFNVPDAAECIVSAAQTANQWVQGDGDDGGVIRVISGGHLAQTQAKWSAVGYNAPAHMIVEAGGLVDFGEHSWIGFKEGAVGTVDIDGGTVTVAGMFGLGWNGGIGFVNVNDGGLLILSNIHGDGASSIKNGSLLGINGTGAVTLPGDFVGVIGTYAAAGLIAGNGIPGAVQVVFADDVTTVTAAYPLIIPILNPGFEAPAYADGAYGPTDGWTLGYYTLPDTTTWEPEEFADNEAHGGYNPAADADYGGVAPEGENVAYTSSFAGYDTGLSQVLSATLQANTQYDLSVLVGNPVLYNEGLTADYRIELLAGGVLLASDTGPSPVDDTTWTTASLSYKSGANAEQLGQPLEIRLLAVDFADWYEVHYDDVTLTATPLIPVANPGFEAPAYADGAYGPTDGWTLGYYTLPDTTTWEPEEFADNEAHGGYNPAADADYGGVAPEGENVAYTSSFAGYDTGLSQVLSATLQANTQYDLSVLVGNPVLYNEGLTADYRIELLAGGVLLASDTGPSPVDDTTWTTASLSYKSGANAEQLGQPLEIRLLAVDFADWYEVHYDDVTLTATPLIPVANPGFEAPAYADGAYGPTDGWTLGYYTLPDTTTWEPEEFADNEAHGGYNPAVNADYGGVAPEGENVAYTSSFVGYDTGLSQVLSATLQANTQYDLSVLVGNPVLYNEGLTADYRIELLAGGVLLASDTGPSPVDDTTWTTASLSYKSGANAEQLGQPLEIRLLAVDFADWYEVYYDDVTLTAMR